MSDQKNKPVLDERAFEKLLEASYVLQEHNRKMRDLEAIIGAERQRELESAYQAPPPREKAEAEETAGDYILTLAQIVEAQRKIQTQNLDLEKTMAVVAESVGRITRASGAGIGILHEKMVRYRAGTGTPALPAGTEVPLKSAICAASVRTGQAIRCEDVDTEVLFDPEPCRQRGIRSLVAVPIYQDGGIVGGLELYFDKNQGYAEQDIHTCQLMAGLVTEALGRDAELELKKSMAAERSSMLAAMEKMHPHLAMQETPISSSNGEGTQTVTLLFCRKCGNTLMAEELFCGKCGMPRTTNDEPNLHSKLAEVWHSQQAANQANLEETFEEKTRAAHASAAISVPELDQTASSSALSLAASAHQDAIELPPGMPTCESLQLEESGEENPEDVKAQPAALLKPEEEKMVWTSATRARDFLESLAGPRTPGALLRFWRSRRGDFYLGIAIILVVAVIRWGIWSDQPAVASGGGNPASRIANRRKPAPDANLSTFDKLLIGLGLAEAPDEPTEYKGNPDTQVWIDLHTALYYCPGSDLYGKTSKGRLASQRDAQLDQFEPAYRQACK